MWIYLISFSMVVSICEGYWVNYPTECKDLNSEEAIRDLCGGNSLINIRNTLLDDSWEKIGEICTPDNSKSKRVRGFFCTAVTKKTTCKVLENLDNKVTYETTIRKVGREECYNHIQDLNLKTEEESQKNLAPFYPPPKCELGKEETVVKTFMVLDETEINLNPLDFEKEDLYLFSLENNRSIIENDLLVERSEYCKLSNWKCHGRKNHIPLEIFKDDDQVSIRLELLKLNILYDSEYGELPLYNSCKMTFCGKEVVRTEGGAIILLRHNGIVEKTRECDRRERNSPIQDLSRKVFKTIGPILLSTLYKRHDLCRKIKDNLKNGRPVPFENLNYINPFEPGWHPAAHYVRIKTSINGALRGRLIEATKLQFKSCNYEIGDAHPKNGTTNFTITFGQGKMITHDNIASREGWVVESIDPEQDQNFTKGRVRVWYNGVMERDNELFFPTTFLIKKFESIYKDKVMISLDGTDSLWVKDNRTEIIVKLEKDTSTKTNLTEDEWSNLNHSVHKVGVEDGTVIMRSNETITIENKSYFTEDFSTWSIYTILSVLGLWVLYRKGVSKGNKVRVRKFIQRFFKLDYRQ
ncbi:non-structural glycoprotein [Hayes Yard virus]|uniref:Non-structural glycoprotein n=1 Tax=Hayes Yard virus TaxID=2602440 RepID=A0A7D0IQK7_9RHAB|nr:non-structural glycoprotein [Hayes Yard virus]QEA08654.1 non-structural glycoprotein [Hayes Yard virus]